jgi:hypothetical protein
MKRVFCIGLLLALCVVTLERAVASVTKRGTTAAPFLEIAVGPRAVAMGGAFTAVANDGASLYWNPAGIDRFARDEVGFNYSQWIAGMDFMYAGAVLHVQDVGSFGVSVTSLATQEMEVRTVDYPEGLGTRFDAADIAIGASYARALTDRFSFGATFKYIQRRIWHMDASAIAADFGILYTLPWNRARLGMTITNFGSKLKMSGVDADVLTDVDPSMAGNNTSVLAQLRTKEWALPFTLRFGVSVDVLRSEQNDVIIAADYEHPNSNDESVNVGAEYCFNKLLSLRAGYQSFLVPDTEEGLTLGIGVQYGGIAIDYSYMDMVHLGYVQQFGARINF